MASIIQKTIKGHRYYYLVESARVNGKPRIVKQQYLGTAETIGASVGAKEVAIPEPLHSVVFDFGAVAALLCVIERIGLRRIIDTHTEKRLQGLNVSSTITLAAINRAVMPKSKNGFYDWFSKTILPNAYPEASRPSLSSQGFWNNMSQLDEKMIRAVENDVTRTVVHEYGISTDCLLFDNTNFFTYIDTATPTSLAQRGHSKQKRSDLKIVGLSLMVSPDHSVPLFHEAYPGNMNDAKQFSEVVERLKKRYANLGLGECRLTLVFDKGNNSEENIKSILGDTKRGFDFIGGLRYNQCPEFNGIDKANLTPLEGERLEGVSAYRTTINIYGSDLTAVLTFNLELYNAQLNGVTANIEKSATQLAVIESKLKARRDGIVTKGRVPTLTSVKKKVENSLSAEHMKSLFNWNIAELEGGYLRLDYSFNEAGLRELKEKRLGRSILFTSRSDWSTEEIVLAYRSQYHIEESFRRMKNSKYLSFRPIHHFTDDKIRVHAFYCVLALLIVSLLHRELWDMGYRVSVERMLDGFQLVKQVITYFPPIGKKKRCVSSFSDIDGFAKEYIDKHNLKQFAYNTR
jgi:transposase